MPSVPQEHPNARFCVSAFRTEADDEGGVSVDSYWTTKEEALSEFERLQAGNFYSLALGFWQSNDAPWMTVDEWYRDE